jgi:hypothetical protein
VAIVDDAIQSDDLACHLKAGHLVAAIFGSKTGFEEACADGVEGCEFLAVGEQCGATFDLFAHSYQVIEAVEFVLGQAHRHAQFPQIAVGTGDIDGLGLGHEQ